MINRIQKGLILTKDEYYIKHLSIINPMFPVPLVNKEIEVLAAFMALPKALTEEDHFNTLARKKVMSKLNLKAGGLSNYIRTMIDKEFLEKSDITGKITIKEYLIPDDKAQGYMFKIVLDNQNQQEKNESTTSSNDSSEIPIIAKIS